MATAPSNSPKDEPAHRPDPPAPTQKDLAAQPPEPAAPKPGARKLTGDKTQPIQPVKPYGQMPKSQATVSNYLGAAAKPQPPAEKPTGSTNPPNKSSGRVAADRQALGLSALAPSEMVQGLDQVVKRAEKMEAREIERKRSGGKIIANVALRVDDTGRRWALLVRLALALIILGVCVLAWLLIYHAGHPTLSPKEANERAHNDLLLLEVTAGKMKHFGEDEKITIEQIKARLLTTIEDDLAAVEKQIAAEKDAHRLPPADSIRLQAELRQLRNLKDPWGRDFNLRMKDDDKLEISIAGQADADSQSLAPVTVPVRLHPKPKKKT